MDMLERQACGDAENCKREEGKEETKNAKHREAKKDQENDQHQPAGRKLGT